MRSPGRQPNSGVDADPLTGLAASLHTPLMVPVAHHGSMRTLVLGATGYIGARLVDGLLGEGHRVRCLVRDPARARAGGWANRVELVVGDVTDEAAVDRACAGSEAVFYLVHGLDEPGYAERDRVAALALTASARRNRVARIVYLGGLQPAEGVSPSRHLVSRREVGEILLDSAVASAVLQAGVVLGSGSAGFEMVRHLAESLPVLPAPARVDSMIQPIGIDDVLHYLLGCLGLPSEANRTFDIGGPDVVSYRELTARYARTAGLATPVSVSVPEAPTSWSARAVAALTPVDRQLAAALLDSMRHDLVCREQDLTALVGRPPGGPVGLDEALRRALAQQGAAGSRASDAAGTGPIVLSSADVREVCAPPERLWRVLVSMGGGGGWNTLPGVWAARGWVDAAIGGVGNRRTRPPSPVAGAAWDSWRIEAVEEGTDLSLRSEMRLPGAAHLHLSVHPLPGGRSRYEQRVSFAPRGLIGRAYWYAQLPAHRLVFGVMASTIVWRAEHGLPPGGAATDV